MKYDMITLSEVSKNGRGYYGIGASAVPYSDELYTYLRITDINDDGTLNMSDLKSVDDAKAGEYVLEPNDIVFARTGASTGRNYFYDGSDGEFVYAGFLIKFSLEPEKINPKYIKYFCQSKQYKDWINSFNTGSTRGNINAQTLAQMPIPLLPREKQDLLVDTLSVLDEKIKLNNKINNNLEEQMLSLFRKQFGYVLQGNDSTLESLIDFSNGKKRPIEDGNIPVYGGNGILAYTNKSNSSNCIVIGRVGAYCGNVFLSTAACWISDNAIQGKCKVSESQLFAYLLLKNAELPSRHIGTGQPLMTQGILNSIPCSIPPIEDILKFNEICTPLQITIENNYAENDNLSTIRDTLLPKLMSGELDVSEINI